MPRWRQGPKPVAVPAMLRHGQAWRGYRGRHGLGGARDAHAAGPRRRLWPGSAHAVAGDREVCEGLPVLFGRSPAMALADHAEDGPTPRSGDEVVGDPTPGPSQTHARLA